MSSTRCLTYHSIPHHPNETEKPKTSNHIPTPIVNNNNVQLYNSTPTPISQIHNNSFQFNPSTAHTQLPPSDNSLLSTLASDWGIDFKKQKRNH